MNILVLGMKCLWISSSPVTASAIWAVRWSSFPNSFTPKWKLSLLMCFSSAETSGLCLGLQDHDIFLGTVGDRWVSCQLDAKTIRTNELFKNRTIAFGKRVWRGVKLRGKQLSHDPILVFILNKTCCNTVFISNEVTNWSLSRMAGSKLLSYWPQTSAAIMFCWPLIASRVAFSSLKLKKFHVSDLSVSWCFWSRIVTGSDSAFISNHFSAQLKWIVNLEVIYTVRVFSARTLYLLIYEILHFTFL